jgi:hypothetical protein
MDIAELETDFGGYVPAEGGTDDAGAHVVHTIYLTAKNEGKVFWDVVKENVEGWLALDFRHGIQNFVGEGLFVLGEGEVVRKAVTVED